MCRLKEPRARPQEKREKRGQATLSLFILSNSLCTRARGARRPLSAALRRKRGEPEVTPSTLRSVPFCMFFTGTLRAVPIFRFRHCWRPFPLAKRRKGSLSPFSPFSRVLTPRKLASESSASRDNGRQATSAEGEKRKRSWLGYLSIGYCPKALDTH